MTDNQPKCGCGRSLHQPYCDGSHGRTDEEMVAWRNKVDLDKWRSQAQDLWWSDGGTCTGGKIE